ncbi:hypothetical protein LK231_1804 [Lactococcus lactis subsp. lactis]|nr:hypothetical protein LK231_1804 [Lactococcus lactis subsp. lactis]
MGMKKLLTKISSVAFLIHRFHTHVGRIELMEFPSVTFLMSISIFLFI